MYVTLPPLLICLDTRMWCANVGRTCTSAACTSRPRPRAIAGASTGSIDDDSLFLLQISRPPFRNGTGAVNMLPSFVFLYDEMSRRSWIGGGSDNSKIFQL